MKSLAIALVYLTLLTSGGLAQETQLQRRPLGVMPALEGYTVDRAAKELPQGVTIHERRLDSELDPGLVVKTYPAKGANLQSGSQVVLFISQNPQELRAEEAKTPTGDEAASNTSGWVVYLFLQAIFLGVVFSNRSYLLKEGEQ